MTGREFTLNYELENILKLNNGQELNSPEEEHFGVKWKVGIQNWNGNFTVWLYANLTDDQEIHVDCTAKPKNKEKTHSNSSSTSFREHGRRYWCISIDWKTVKTEYFNDKKLEMEVYVKINKTFGIPREALRSFGEDMEQFSDVILKVEDRKFYVSKLYLSSQSSLFPTVFLGQFLEFRKTQIVLKLVNPDDIQCFLEVIYAEDAVDEDTVERILPIADMYETPVAIRKCEEFLIKESKMTLKKKLVLAEFYKLE
ncbi:unnamed protein product [Caenorhabditis nigoni]